MFALNNDNLGVVVEIGIVCTVLRCVASALISFLYQVG